MTNWSLGDVVRCGLVWFGRSGVFWYAKIARINWFSEASRKKTSILRSG